MNPKSLNDKILLSAIEHGSYDSHLFHDPFFTTSTENVFQ